MDRAGTNGEILRNPRPLAGRRPGSEASATNWPSLQQALRFWLKLGFISFGGPTGQIAIMHEELVDRRRWIGESRFLHALNYCMLLPGPEAQQLATYIGWLLHGWRGALLAGSLFVLPSVAILWALSALYVSFGAVDWVEALFYGLKPAVIAIVAYALVRLAKRALRNEVTWGVAILAFLALALFDLPFPAIIIAAGLVGLVGGRIRPGMFVTGVETRPRGSDARQPVQEPVEDDSQSAASVPESESPVLPDEFDAGLHEAPTLRRAVRVVALGLALWWLPVLALGLWRGWDSNFVREGVFFSQAALVTFGGAYAVLPYVAQRAVEDFGWLTAGQMLDGLGLAETTPGPLIMVLQFVGFLGAWNQPEGLPPLLAGTIGALITTWVTFVPCFIWILLGAPYVERVRHHMWLTGALSTITAAVVGVMLSLAVWFAGHVLFPRSGEPDGFAMLVTLLAFAALVRNWGVVPVVLGGALAGVIRQLLIWL
jgi:chromate transporter